MVYTLIDQALDQKSLIYVKIKTTSHPVLNPTSSILVSEGNANPFFLFEVILLYFGNV